LENGYRTGTTNMYRNRDNGAYSLHDPTRPDTYDTCQYGRWEWYDDYGWWWNADYVYCYTVEATKY